MLRQVIRTATLMVFAWCLTRTAAASDATLAALEHARDDSPANPPSAIAERGSDQLQNAWRLLAKGEATAAMRQFEQAMNYWRQHQSVGRGYADAQRGLVIAALLAKDDAGANRALNEIHGSVAMSRGSALIFAGRWNDGYAAFRDETAHEPLMDGADPLIASGVEAARSGDRRKAIQIWSKPPDGSGGSYLHDIQQSLIGIAFAQLGEWDRAVDAWLEASSMGRPVPEWEGLETGNIIALDMLYHFRDRYVRGDHTYHLRVDPGRFRERDRSDRRSSPFPTP
jgi:tetratricopeptide (TPR) repeat protein